MRRHALRENHRKDRVQNMTRVNLFRLITAGALMLFSTASISAGEVPTPAAVSGFNDYVGQVEARLAGQHKSAAGFLAPVDEARVKNGDVVLEHLTPAATKELAGALLQDW